MVTSLPELSLFRPLFFFAFLLPAGLLPAPAYGYTLEETSLYIREIRWNDTCSMHRSKIDSLHTAQGELFFPPLHEIEFELGLPADSTYAAIQYRLVGQEEGWKQTRHPSIRYTNLANRQYELRIRPVGHKTQTRLVFTSAALENQDIRQEWWFQPLLTFCLLLIPFTVIYFLALNRSRRNLRLEVVRNQIASDLHDDVGANLGAINNLTDLLSKRHQQQDPDGRSRIIDKIKNYTQHTIINLRDTVWAINPLNDSVVELLGKMKEFASLMLNAKEIAINYQDKYQAELPIKLDMQQRHAMFVMFKEVINNIVKHAEATAVDVNIHNDRTSLTIEVRDNGKGFDTNELYRGNGLKNFRRRAEENFIDLDLESRPGAGARIQMVIHSLD